MKAAVLHTSPGQLVIEDVTIDDPRPDEVLIRTAASGLCHSDYHHIDGHIPFPVPVVLGHEAAGIVEAVGNAVTDVQVGDTVVTFPSPFCGHCTWCLSGRPVLCDRVGVGRTPSDPPRLRIGDMPIEQLTGLSSFAEQMLVHQHSVVRIRPDVPLDVISLIGCGVSTGVGAVWHSAQVKPGSTVAVIGCGGVGLNVIQGAVLAGASRVIAIDTKPTKLDLAKQFGATDVVDASAGAAVAQVIDLTNGGVDYSFEVIGTKATVEQAFAMLGKAGVATVIGVVPPGTKIEVDGLNLLSERRLQGTAMGASRFRQDVGQYIDLYLAGRLKLDELVSARITLDEVNDGFAAMTRGEVARSVIVF